LSESQPFSIEQTRRCREETMLNANVDAHAMAALVAAQVFGKSAEEKS